MIAEKSIVECQELTVEGRKSRHSTVCPWNQYTAGPFNSTERFMLDDPSHEALTQIQTEIGSAVYATVQDCGGEPRLVCASRKDECGNGHGNSFWVALHDTTWFLVTWWPRYYRCPPDIGC